MLYFGKSDIGSVRQTNQDSFSVKEYSDSVLLAVVCDGIGGSRGGSVASYVAAESFIHAFDLFVLERLAKDGSIIAKPDDIKAALDDAVVYSNHSVYSRASADSALEGMGTTLVALLVSGSTLYTVNVGDSRMYLISDTSLKQVTRDHSYVQYLVDIGRLSADDARRSPSRNIITRAIGTENASEADIFVSELYTDDSPSTASTYALLCTDGLTNHVSPDELLEIVNTESRKVSVQTRVQTLIDRANAAGGSDNITVVLIAL